MQRFGSTSSVPTFAIGIALLKEDYEKAVHLILDPREGDILYFSRQIFFKNL